MKKHISENAPLKRPFMHADRNYFVNTGFYSAYKRVLNWRKFKREQVLNKVFISERTAEIPFAIKHLSALPPGASVLDLGCVESPLPLMVASLGFNVTGYDAREYPYVHPKITFTRGDICDMPFANGVFDAVICVSTIEHLGIGFYDDPDRVEAADKAGMKEIFRVLKNNGKLILSAPVGNKQMTGHQRVYDVASFQRLFKDFSVLEEKFFINSRSSQGTPNYWQESTVSQIGRISDASGGTVAVGMAAAIKEPEKGKYDNK